MVYVALQVLLCPDFVGRPPLLLGGNPSTGGNCWLCYAHSSYNAEIPSQYLMNERGEFIDKKGNIVQVGKRIDNKYYLDNQKKWGGNNSSNPSLPVLVPASKVKEIVKYEVNPF